MFEEPRSAAAGLAQRLAALEPEELSEEAAAELFELAFEIERIGAGLRRGRWGWRAPP